jgi:hypothetical protein
MATKKGPTPKRKWDPLVQVEQSVDPQVYLDAGLTEPDAVYGNKLYSVFVREIGHGALHISFHRRDRSAVHDWRHMQAIKNEVAGPDRLALEIYPPEHYLIDSANEYHLWVVPPGTEESIPFLMRERFIGTQEEMEAEYGRSKARQRPWEREIPTGLGATT